MLHLGEKCDTRFEIYVDKRSACKLNSGEDKLYDILILHLEGGKDIFITVTGSNIFNRHYITFKKTRKADYIIFF